MDEWESLDQHLVCVMREIHAESVRIADDDKLEVVITYMRKLVALQNGVANCSRHALGCKWRAVHDRHKDDKGNKERIGSSLDMLQDNLNNAQYVLYGASLAKCGCEASSSTKSTISEYITKLIRGNKTKINQGQNKIID